MVVVVERESQPSRLDLALAFNVFIHASRYRFPIKPTINHESVDTLRLYRMRKAERWIKDAESQQVCRRAYAKGRKNHNTLCASRLFFFLFFFFCPDHAYPPP